MNHSDFMFRALESAIRRIGITSPNPPVGAVVVKEGVIVSEGGTQVCGGDHAEVCALRSAGYLARDADLYVTLEPCCHHGKTPPCTDAIITAGIRRVFIPITDPNPKVAGGGISVLRDAGIEVTIIDECADKARQVMRPFFTLMEMERPHVLYKTAMTADGFTATKTGDSKWISSSLSRLIVHRLRTLVDAIIVGRGAFETDNPSLESRLEEFKDDEIVLKHENPELSGSDNIVLRYILGNGFDHPDKSPLRVLAGLPADITGNEKFFRDDNYIVFAEEAKINYRNDVIRGMCERGKIVPCGAGKDFTDGMMTELMSRGVMWAMLEGGGETAGKMVDVIDEYLAFVAPRILGGGKSVLCGHDSALISDSYPLDEISTAILGNDIMYHGYRRRTCSPV